MSGGVGVRRRGSRSPSSATADPAVHRGQRGGRRHDRRARARSRRRPAPAGRSRIDEDRSASAGAIEQRVAERDRGQPQPVDERVPVDRRRAPADSIGASWRAIAAESVIAPPPSRPAAARRRPAYGGRGGGQRERDGRARPGRPAARAGRRAPSPSSRATANGTTVASDGDAGRARRRLPATSAASASTEPRDLGRGSRRAAAAGRSSARRWATTAAKALTHHDRGEQRDHPDDHVVEQVDRVGARRSARAPRVRSSMPTSIRVPTAAGGEHDDRGEHAGEQVRAARGVVRRELPGGAGAADRPARSAARPSAAAPARASPGRRRPGSSSSRRSAWRRTGRRSAAVTVIGDDGHRRRRTPISSSAMATRHQRHPARPGRGLGEREGGRAAGGPAGGDRGRDQAGQHHEQRRCRRATAGPPPYVDVVGDHAAVAEQRRAGRSRPARRRSGAERGAGDRRRPQASARTRRRAWRGVAPTMRSSPISSARCRTVMPRVEATENSTISAAPAADDGAHDRSASRRRRRTPCPVAVSTSVANEPISAVPSSTERNVAVNAVARCRSERRARAVIDATPPGQLVEVGELAGHGVGGRVGPSGPRPGRRRGTPRRRRTTPRPGRG